METETDIIPIILCGGSGTRLWPLSRPSKPKQFLSFGRKHSLFQETVNRCTGKGFADRAIVVGAEKVRFLIAEDLVGVDVHADILLEPSPRNSCAAIAAGCLQALKRNRNALVLVVAADHYIPEASAFREAVIKARADAMAGNLVTFGVTPTRPATGYGYIFTGEELIAARKVNRFVEKPSPVRASEFVDKGYLWNSGNFLFRAADCVAEIERLQPALARSVSRAFENAEADLDFIRLEREAFGAISSISFDHAVMEKTDRAAVLPVDYRWSDIGNWDAVGDMQKVDPDGNSVTGKAVMYDAINNVVHSANGLTTVVGINNTIVVSTRDCVLVADRSSAEDVKELVATLQHEGRSEAEMALQIFRPWGNYEQLDCAERYQVKRLLVKPGCELSLQKHKRRAEHWVIVEGVAEVTIGDEVRTMRADQSTYVPLGAVHRLANRGDEPVVIIEVQTGDYFGEDDIVRLEDRYKRDPLPAGVMD